MNLLEYRIGETVTEKSYTSCGLRKITLRFNGTSENLVWKTSQEYTDLAELKGLHELKRNMKQQISKEYDSKENDNDTERLLYVGKGSSRRYETHCSEIRRQVKNLLGKKGEEHVIKLNTTYSKYLAIAILLLEKRKIIFQTIKNYENEEECLQDEAILIQSKKSSLQNISPGVIVKTVNVKEKARYLESLLEDSLTLKYTLDSTERNPIYLNRDNRKFSLQCAICSVSKETNSELTKHYDDKHKRGHIDEEKRKEINDKDRKRYLSKLQKMTEDQLSQFRETVRARGKKYRESMTAEQKRTKLDRYNETRRVRYWKKKLEVPQSNQKVENDLLKDLDEEKKSGQSPTARKKSRGDTRSEKEKVR